MNSFLKYRNIGIAVNNIRKIPLPILFSVNCQILVITISPAIISLIFLFNMVCVYFKIAKIVKGIKNIFIKLLARKKSLCIFALGFGTTVVLKLGRHINKILKIQSNEQKNVSTIEKKKKK